MNVEINIKRLEYLLDKFQLTREELVKMLNEKAKLKKPLEQSDFFNEQIKVSNLKRIDKLFGQGLNFYVDPAPISKVKDASIFFRKTDFQTKLNYGAVSRVNEFEDLSIHLSSLAKLSDINLNRFFRKYTVKDDPSTVGNEIREMFNSNVPSKSKDYLRVLIEWLSQANIFVFEFVDTWNKTHKANIDGFFISPRTIVLKRNQQSFKREIFTLMHEFGHLLLLKEEVEALDDNDLDFNTSNRVERWCNHFAFSFLIGPFSKQMNSIQYISAINDYEYEIIDLVSKNSHLSRIAIYTNLFFKGKMDRSTYLEIKEEEHKKYEEYIEQQTKKREREEALGKKSNGRSPKPIQSSLFVSTMQHAYYEGLVSEYEFAKTLNIKAENIEALIP